VEGESVEARLRSLFELYARRVFAYSMRQVADPGTAQDVVAGFRPTDESLDALWMRSGQDALLAEVLASDATEPPAFLPSRRHRRARAYAVLAAAAAAAVIAIPLVLPSGGPGGASPAAAAELDRLAAVAATAPFDEVRAGQFVHTVVQERQSGALGSGADRGEIRGVIRNRVETWTARDGSIWGVDTESGGPSPLPGPTYYHRVDVDGAGGYDTLVPSPQYLASLPSTAAGLNFYLRKRVSGSTSKDETVFVAVGDMLRDGFAPRGLRIAAVGVLKRTPHVTLGPSSVDMLNRPAVEFDFIDAAHRPGEIQALFFDPNTAEIIEEKVSGPDSGFSSIVEMAEVVDAVPAEVVQKAVRQK